MKTMRYDATIYQKSAILLVEHAILISTEALNWNIQKLRQKERNFPNFQALLRFPEAFSKITVIDDLF